MSQQREMTLGAFICFLIIHIVFMHFQKKLRDYWWIVNLITLSYLITTQKYN